MVYFAALEEWKKEMAVPWYKPKTSLTISIGYVVVTFMICSLLSLDTVAVIQWAALVKLKALSLILFMSVGFWVHKIFQLQQAAWS